MESTPYMSSFNRIPRNSQSERNLFSRSERGKFFDKLEGSQSYKNPSEPLPSPLTQNIEDFDVLFPLFYLIV